MSIAIGSGDALTSTAGMERIGDAEDELIVGGEFDDRLAGKEGDDTLFGQDGDDLVWGGEGDDAVFGGSGNDELMGGAGDDRLYGGEGDDTLFAEEGDNTLVGGSGDDVYVSGSGADTIYTEGAGHDVVYGFELGVDRIHWAPPDLESLDDVEVADDGSGNAVITNGDDDWSLTVVGLDPAVARARIGLDPQPVDPVPDVPTPDSVTVSDLDVMLTSLDGVDSYIDALNPITVVGPDGTAVPVLDFQEERGAVADLRAAVETAKADGVVTTEEQDQIVGLASDLFQAFEGFDDTGVARSEVDSVTIDGEVVEGTTLGRDDLSAILENLNEPVDLMRANLVGD